MNRMKKLVSGVVVLGMMVLVNIMVNKAEAGSTESLVLLITPAVNYSVSITSATDGQEYDFGTVDLNVTTRTERPAVVQNNGNIISEWQVSAITSEGVWSLGNSTGAQNAAVLKALFNSNGGSVPADADYDTSNGSTITVSAKAAENSSLSTNTALVTNIPVSAQRDLYFMMHTPENVNGSGAQRFRVYVTAVAP